MSWILSIMPIQPRNYLHIWQEFSDSFIACFAGGELWGLWSTGQSLWFKCPEIGMKLCSNVKRQDFIYGAPINVVLCILVLTWGRPLADVYACGKLYIATNKVLMFVSEITVNETLTKNVSHFQNENWISILNYNKRISPVECWDLLNVLQSP